AINYLYYTTGNAVAVPAAVAAPTKSSEAVTISKVNYVQSVPAPRRSRALRRQRRSLYDTIAVLSRKDGKHSLNGDLRVRRVGAGEAGQRCGG
ncbi:MAG: hypothetical protein HC888_06940, partial [Candidatus Competibacteraceae bacterium]|nr:hypothetical protein [Candidatus Competibacteraceae bacterium]